MMKPRRLGLIGCGRIGQPVIDAWRAGGLAGWELVAVLARAQRGEPVTADADAFFAAEPELVVEVAGPAALAQHGVRALQQADVWTVSGAALADEAVRRQLEDAGTRHGHRLRVLHGAIAGLDGVAASSVDPAVELHLAIDLPPGLGAPGRVFRGTVREAALRYPDSVNVAVAAALAGPGLDRTTIDVSHPDPPVPQQLGLRAASCYGGCTAVTTPRVDRGHPVAASVIAALRNAVATIWT